jgi:hypothetical protein
MWDHHSFEALTQKFPVDIDVNWDKAPSVEKYGAVNVFLVLLSVFIENSGKLLLPNRKDCSLLTIQPMKRKLCDVRKRNFTIIGYPTTSPLLLCEIDPLIFEIYFNYHLFVIVETTLRQYFPSASVMVRCQNFLQSHLTPSPGSWCGDIIPITFDWDGTFILETSSNGVPTKLRKKFRGFKFIPSIFKYFITREELPHSEKKFIENNGFEVITLTSLNKGMNQIRTLVQKFLTAQIQRMSK